MPRHSHHIKFLSASVLLHMSVRGRCSKIDAAVKWMFAAAFIYFIALFILFYFTCEDGLNAKRLDMSCQAKPHDMSSAFIDSKVKG